MKYQVTTYITGVLVKLFEVDARSRDDARDKATALAVETWKAGNLAGWDMTMDNRVDEDATEVVDG